jgi:hypothetical protein
VIEINESDIGRRVVYAPKSNNPADRMYGTLAKLWDGIPYIKFDYQPANAPPIPEHPSLLSWETEDASEDPEPVISQEETYTAIAAAQEDGDEGILASNTFGSDLITSMSEAVAMTTDDPEPSFSGDGGDFGGGGASADWGDSGGSDGDASDD